MRGFRFDKVRIAVAFAAVVFISTVAFSAESSGGLFQTDVFVSGESGYNTYRIPALLTTDKGTVLAFAEARKNSHSDA